jgi:L-lactate dehydrogenase
MKIGIVGVGQVGATAAYSMMMSRVGSGILLVDRDADLAIAQARDILDATSGALPSGSGRRSGAGRVGRLSGRAYHHHRHGVGSVIILFQKGLPMRLSLKQ